MVAAFVEDNANLAGGASVRPRALSPSENWSRISLSDLSGNRGYLDAMRLVAGYLTVAQSNQAMSPLHDQRIVGREEEGCTRRAIELLHHIEKLDRRSRVEICRGLIRED